MKRKAEVSYGNDNDDDGDDDFDEVDDDHVDEQKKIRGLPIEIWGTIETFL